MCQTRPLPDPGWCRQSIQSFGRVSWSPAMLSPKYSADRKSWKILPLSVPSICCWQPKLDNKRCKHITHPPHPMSASLLPFRKYDLQIIVFFLKSYYYIKKLGSHRVWTSIQFISTLSKFLFPSGFVSKICSNFKLQNKTEAVPYLIWYYLVKAPFFSWKK